MTERFHGQSAPTRYVQPWVGIPCKLTLFEMKRLSFILWIVSVTGSCGNGALRCCQIPPYHKHISWRKGSGHSVARSLARRLQWGNLQKSSKASSCQNGRRSIAIMRSSRATWNASTSIAQWERRTRAPGSPWGSCNPLHPWSRPDGRPASQDSHSDSHSDHRPRNFAKATRLHAFFPIQGITV